MPYMFYNSEYDFRLTKIKEEPKDSGYGVGKTLLLTDLDGQLQIKQEPIDMTARNSTFYSKSIVFLCYQLVQEWMTYVLKCF